MSLRAVLPCLLLAVFSPFVTSADDLLDYQKIGPVQIVERMAQTLVAGSSAERRAVTEEAHELGESYLASFGEDGEAGEFFTAAGEAFIPLFWTSKSTVRVRSERILASLIDDLGPYMSSSDEPKNAFASKVLERYASLMMVSPGNSSSGKLLEEMRQIFEAAKHEFTVTAATEFTAFEGLPNPNPAFGKNEGEKTVAVARPKDPTHAQSPAPVVVDGNSAEKVRTIKAPSTKEEVRVVSAAGNSPAVKPATLKRVSAKSVQTANGATAVARVSAANMKGVTGAVGAQANPTEVISVKGARPARVTASRPTAQVSARSAAGRPPKSRSSAALRILYQQLQSENERQLLAAFGLASTLYDKIGYSAKNGVGAEREVAENIVVRARMLVGSPKVPVQKAAIKMVAELGDERSMGQLIRLLAEKHNGVAPLALDALKKLTGEDFGYSIEGWQKWWALR